MVKPVKGALEKHCGSFHSTFLEKSQSFIDLWVEQDDPVSCHAKLSHKLKLWWEAHLKCLCFVCSSLYSAVWDILVHRNDFQVICLQSLLFVVGIIFLNLLSCVSWLIDQICILVSFPFVSLSSENFLSFFILFSNDLGFSDTSCIYMV